MLEADGSFTIDDVREGIYELEISSHTEGIGKVVLDTGDLIQSNRYENCHP